MIKIKPINRLPVSQVSFGEIRINVKSDVYASMTYTTHDIGNTLIDSGIVTFSKEELGVWGDDDNILNDLLLEKLGYEKDTEGE